MSVTIAVTSYTPASVASQTQTHCMTKDLTIKCGNCGYVIDINTDQHIIVKEKIKTAYYHKESNGCYNAHLKQEARHVRKK